MRLKCITNKYSNQITLDKYYQVNDIDTIGYQIIDDLGRNFWYIKGSFVPIEEKRDKLLNQLINNF